ncbi:MAG TPA: TRAP transporter fused permease subunit [Azospirillaceae bacterium]|nr:TRAP transporter fused permease subunit [Azospirillaceae bacterium]
MRQDEIERLQLSEEELERLAADSEGGPAQRLTGPIGWLVAAVAFGLSAYSLYWTQFAVNTTVYRSSFLSIVLALIFVLYPIARIGNGKPAGPGVADWIVSALGIATGAWLFTQTQVFQAGGSGAAVAILLTAIFALYPLAARSTVILRYRVFDWILAAVAIWITLYLAMNTEAVKTRATRPTPEELVLGGALIVLVLEATRRTVGWVLPAITAVFLVYCYFGPSIPEPFDHRGFSAARIIGQNYLTLEGVFSTPMDVAATFIILFTIYGAVLDRGGAGRFFIDWAFALFGKKPSPSAPGRAVVASGFLLGTVSGSGVATTVTIASLAWPLLKRSGYTPNIAGGMLSAAGIGATLSPPTLGAAAFIIAEYLDVDYLQILVYATIPTILYYLSCWLMTEADARRLNVKPAKTSDASVWQLTITQGYHFLSLAAIAVFLVLGFTSFMAVFWSIAIAFVLSLIRPESRLVTLPAAMVGALVFAVLLLAGDGRVSVAAFLGIAVAMLVSGAQNVAGRLRGDSPDPASGRMIEALTDGARAVLGIVATCACAGIIVSVVNLTGLGLTISSIIVQAGGGSRLGTIALAAIAMWILGTAVPVTASYIIAAVMLVPALINVGIPAPAAHMFMFYYAVLSDVSPPTALAPFAVSAITGGRPFGTMMQAWKYTLPAFLVPVMFCLTPEGLRLLMVGPDGQVPGDVATWLGILATTATACLALVGLCVAATGYAAGITNIVERTLAGIGGVLLLMADPWLDAVGAALLLLALTLHWVRIRSVTASAT